MKRKGLLLLSSLVLLSLSCKKSPGTSPVPYVAVNQKIDISKSEYNILTVQGGYLYLVGVGNKGIVVIYNFDGNYYALDRTCPYHVNSSCGVIRMAYNGSQFVCGTYNGSTLDACCTSTYGFDGTVIHGPSAFPLKSYKVTVSGTVLTITN